MIDQTMPSASQLNQSSPLQLPLQAAPIDRSQSPASAMASNGGGVEAAFSWTDLIPIATSLLSDRTLKRNITPVEWSR